MCKTLQHQTSTGHGIKNQIYQMCMCNIIEHKIPTEKATNYKIYQNVQNIDASDTN